MSRIYYFNSENFTNELSHPPDHLYTVLFTVFGLPHSNETENLSCSNDIFSFSHVSLAQHNKALNVRLTNPLPKDPEDDTFDDMLKEDETWAIYVNFYMESEIRYCPFFSA